MERLVNTPDDSRTGRRKGIGVLAAIPREHTRVTVNRADGTREVMNGREWDRGKARTGTEEVVATPWARAQLDEPERRRLAAMVAISRRRHHVRRQALTRRTGTRARPRRHHRHGGTARRVSTRGPDDDPGEGEPEPPPAAGWAPALHGCHGRLTAAGHDPEGPASIPERLRALGYASYRDYLASEHWADVKRRFRRSERPPTCAVCGDPRVELHHRTYARLGREFLADLVPLCRAHHRQAHEPWRSGGGS